MIFLAIFCVGVAVLAVCASAADVESTKLASVSESRVELREAELIFMVIYKVGLVLTPN